MDGDLAANLQAVLSDPEQMEKLSEMAKSLFAQSPGGGEQRQDPPARKDPSLGQPDERFLSVIGKAFARGGEKSRSTALLLAMRPYMRPEKQEKLDRAMRIARMANIAGAVMRQYGDGHGV